MKPFVSYVSTHPAIADDRVFFAKNPHRRYRARQFQPTEIGLPPGNAVFATDEHGAIREVNLVILKRIRGGRERFHFAACVALPLTTDLQIWNFLQSRGVTRVSPAEKGRRR